jgi:hypothetical protein
MGFFVMPESEQMRDWVALRDEEMIVLEGDGFDAAILGIVTGAGQPDRVLYSRQGVIDALVDQGMDLDGAVEWFEFNISGAYMGEKSPAFLETPDDA